MKVKKKDFYFVMIVSILLIMVVGGTFAYFQAQIGKGAEAGVNVTAKTTDSLMFDNIESSISIEANQDNFGLDDGSISKTASVKATLTPNNQTGAASKKYNIFLILEHNTLEYTNNSTPELLVKLSKKTGEEYKEYETKISELDYKTNVEDIKKEQHSGYDITTKHNAVYKLASDVEITATSNTPTTDEWQVEVTLVNLSSEQNKNTGKSFKGSIYITSEEDFELPRINTITTTTTENSLTINTIGIDGTNEIDKYYYKVEETNKTNSIVKRLASTKANEYQEGTAEYTINSLDNNKNYEVTVVALDKKGYESNVYRTIVTIDGIEIPVIDSVSSSATEDSITVNVTASGDITNYYYQIDGGEWIDGTTSNSHTFNSLKDNTSHQIKIKVKDSNGKYSNEYEIEVKTNEKANSEETGPSITDRLIADANSMSSLPKDTTYLNDRAYSGKLVYHDENSQDETVKNYGAADEGYRYTGDNPNNFVCFGPGAEGYSRNENEATCDAKNLYRIIGIVPVETENNGTQNLIKLIQSEYATQAQLGNGTPGNNYSGSLSSSARVKDLPTYGFYWNKTKSSTYYNIWADDTNSDNSNSKNATLNQALNDANTGYLHYLDNSTNQQGINWTSKIETVKWNIAGGSGSEISSVTAKTAYDNEKSETTAGGIQATQTTSTAKIGLMYVHDYGFASDKSNWNTNLNGYSTDDNRNKNWLFNGVSELTISRDSDAGNGAFFISNAGGVRYDRVSYSTFGVRPVFYLKSDTQITGGNGTALTPYRINSQ